MAETDKGFFTRLKERLTKTRTNLVDNIRRVLAGRTRIDADVYEEIEEILITADLGVETSLALIDDMRSKAEEQQLEDPEGLLEILKNDLRQLLEPGNHSLELRDGDAPCVILVVGVNGSGKTTTIGKLAARLIGEGNKVLLGAGDTFRAAAVEQLTIWSDRVHAPIIKHKDGADPAAVAYDAADAAVSRGMDCLIIDTAGRLHTKVNLMEELKKIQRAVGKRISGAPHEVLLVLDATTGQNGLQQARQFTEALNVTGIVLTKLDGTAKGGIVVAIQKQLGIPIKFIGVGEKVDDLQPFDAQRFVDALLSA
jgi:fused signal recognition particle receptor